MIKKFISLIVVSVPLFLLSCVLQTEHDKVVTEKETIEQERDNLKQELEEINFGAPNLLSDAKKFFAAKDFSQARQKFQTLLDKHHDTNCNRS